MIRHMLGWFICVVTSFIKCNNKGRRQPFGKAKETGCTGSFEDGTCKFQHQKAVKGGAVNVVEELMSGEVKTLEKAVATYGPISIGLSAGSDGFRHYGGGVFDGKDCEPSKINHGALLVGYGSEGGKDYWIIKNSWGTKWGEEGYMRLEKKNYENICGIASSAIFPVLI